MHRVLVSGSTGLVGSELIDWLKRKDFQPVRLVRKKGVFDEPQISWDIARGHLNPADLQGIDAVVHLAGESIGGGRWTEERKQRILESRVQGTRLLAETLAKMEHPPKTLICASAIGYYGNRGNEWLTEVSDAGHGFLADVCRQWEAAAQPARDKGIRVIHTRFGLILSAKGGALKAMLWPFRLGLAGQLGSGRQYMSWIALPDVIGVLLHALNHSDSQADLQGPVNVVSPNPVTNAEFTRILRQRLISPLLPMHYWTPPAPAWAIKALLGEMGEELLLSSARVAPVALQGSGYTFQYTDLRDALEAVL